MQNLKPTSGHQQSQNEVKTVEAEANKKIAKAKGDAESRVIEAKQLPKVRSLKPGRQQKSQKLKAQADAESTRVNAAAQAEANKKLSQSLSKELIQYRSIDRWDGKLPQVSGQNTPLISLTQPK